ncbi:MAG: DNA-formamidopyrimidine glycosylase family protein [Dehalococcoidia bacterium]
MPEIPDLEAIRGFLEPRLAGHLVTRTEVRYPWLIRSEDKMESLEGHALGPIGRYGKFLLFTVDDGRRLVVNPMLTGRFHWAVAGERKRPGTCVVLGFDDGNELRYSDARRMGRWYLVPADGLDLIPQWASLGPDALAITEDEFLAGLKKHRGQAKNVLTNQEFMAGIGNAYSDEILWEARIHPHRRVATLDEEQRRGLFLAMHAVFDWARPILEAEVRDGLYQRNEEWRDHLRVHRKAEQACPRCGSTIRSQVQSSRETDYCLTCQPLAL